MWNRRRNWILRRLVLGLAVLAVAAPTAQARVDEGIKGQPNAPSELVVADGYAGIEAVRAAPRGSLRSLDGVELVRLQPRTGSPEVVATSTETGWGDVGIVVGLASGVALLAGAAFFGTRRLLRPQTA